MKNRDVQKLMTIDMNELRWSSIWMIIDIYFLVDQYLIRLNEV